MYTRGIGGTRHASTRHGPADLAVHLVGPLPILQHFLGRMGFHRTVCACLGSRATRESRVDHGQTLAVLIQNIILSPAPLYRIAEWAAPYDAPALGLTPDEKHAINDDRVARSLDVLASHRARSLFFRLALTVIKQFELDTRRIHHDTTTVTFHGRYEQSLLQPRILNGYNKDHRPDLKQLVFGLNVTADGAVPISHEIHSGNTADDTIHLGNIEKLRQLIGHDVFIYVADSKLATRKNLSHIDSYGGKFVTVMPRSWAPDKHFRSALRQGMPVRWRRLVTKEQAQHAQGPQDSYWSTADGPRTTEDGYHIVWCKSAEKAEFDAQARIAAINKAEAELHDLGLRLNRGRLKSASEIRKEVKAILGRHKVHAFLGVRLAWNITVTTKRLRPGRPRRGDPVRTIRTRQYFLVPRRDTAAIAGQARTDGVFPLLTNISQNRTAKREILRIYKYQPYVEKRHALLKTELEVAPVYLKKPHRAAGLIHASFLAMMLDALIERALRQAMQRQHIDSLPVLPEGRSTRTPATARLLEMFSGTAWYQFNRGGETVTFPVELTDLQRQLLRLLGMDTAAYA